MDNLATLGLSAVNAEVRRRDALTELAAAGERGEHYELILIDPPYASAAELAGALSKLVAPLLAPGARVAVESDRRAPLELELAVARARRYGDTSITIHGER